MTTNYRDELDDRSRAKLETLLQTPHRNATTAARQRADYLVQARSMPAIQPARGLFPWLQAAVAGKILLTRSPLRLPSVRIMVAALEILLIVVSSSFFTVFAANDSLPSDPIYPVKLLAEDVRMSLTSKEGAKVVLALELAETRMEEIVALQEKGEPVEAPVINRMEEHYQLALETAAIMPDPEMSVVLQEVQDASHDQLATMTTLVATAPEESENQLIYAKRMLLRNENLAKNGIKHPAGFRNAMGNKGGAGAVPNNPIVEPVDPAIELEEPQGGIDNRPSDAGKPTELKPGFAGENGARGVNSMGPAE